MKTIRTLHAQTHLCAGIQARVNARVFGMVQGVGYRRALQAVAADLGMTGYVRNRSDKTVEFVAEGSPRALARLLAYARVGPASASVADVVWHLDTPCGEFAQFRILS